MRKWTRELFWDVASKYDSKADLCRGNKGAHRAGEREGWLYEFPFKKKATPKNYWNRERCYNEALKFTSRTKFHRSSPSAYTSALNHNWLDDYDWFISKCNNRNKCIYVYEFKELKAAYVGLTRNKRSRHLQHLGQCKYQSQTTVNKFAAENNTRIPAPIYKYDNLNDVEAQEKENLVINSYKEKGWFLINRAKTGRGIGSLGGYNYKWDKDTCKKEAQLYKNKKEFHKKNAGAYTASLKNEWLTEFFPDSNQPIKQKPKGYWDIYDNCKKEATKYTTKSNFRINNLVAYRKAIKHKWIDTFFPKIIEH